MDKDYFPSGEEKVHYGNFMTAIFAIVITAILIMVSRDNVFVLGVNVRPLYLWELASVCMSVLLTAVYFIDMLHMALDASIKHKTKQLWIGLLSGLSFLTLLTAAAALFTFAFFNFGAWLYFIYLGLLMLSFVMFAVLDYLAALVLLGYRKTREYWALCLFNDGPTTVSFTILLIYSFLYYENTNKSPDLNLIGGAIAMQMLMNSAIYIGVITNVVFRLLRHCGANITSD